MILLGDIPVLTSIYQIMVVLQRDLRISGSHLLKDIIEPKYGNKDIMFTCPFHKNGMENRPSCGITISNINVPVGTFHCFQCQAHGDITELISYCFGKHDGGIFGKRWILDRFSNYEIENREGFFNRIHNNKTKSTKEYIKEEELKKYRYTHPYMYKRGLTDDTIDIFDIGYDNSFSLGENLKKFGCITFPIKDEDGNVLFVARRSINTKLFWYPNNVDKPLAYLYESKKLFPYSKELYIVESLFNALTLIQFKKPCVALLGTGSSSQINKLKYLDYRKYIFCLDGDVAGRKATDRLIRSLKKYKLCERIEMIDGKDVNDFKYCKSYDEFINELKRKR